ncbi:hypothetical protein NIES4073_63930 [Kalymmatonema gypsitolerans NIES-4073]|nr:hypothetical protein NIES4073_63930 [Scytonema sp. NIES-4073]
MRSAHADKQAAVVIKRRAIESNGLTILVVRKLKIGTSGLLGTQAALSV